MALPLRRVIRRRVNLPRSGNRASNAYHAAITRHRRGVMFNPNARLNPRQVIDRRGNRKFGRLRTKTVIRRTRAGTRAGYIRKRPR